VTIHITRPPKLLSVNQVADVLNVSTKTVRRTLGNGLHFHRIGSAVRVSSEDLSAYLNSTRK
jgi:excisionase family DNA binding protein